MEITNEQLRQIIKEELEAVLSEEEGKKDACYHKVKARYDVWPSAYASGALSKCRKVGAKNWGNSKKNEELELDEASFRTGVYSVEESELKTAERMMQKYRKYGFDKQADAIQKAIEKGRAKEISSKEFMRLLDAANKLEEEFIPGGESSKYDSMELDGMIDAIAKDHGVSPEDIRKQFDMGVEEEMEHATEELIAQEIALDHLVEDPEYYTKLDRANLQEEKKKAGTESSKESNLRDWFGRKGAKGSKGGWVDCNAPDGKGGYKSCGRSDGEKRSKYPSCRPTPGACKEKGKGKSWGKKSAKGKK